MIYAEAPFRRRPRKLTARWKRQERCVWMTTNLAKWASNNGQIIKSGLPNARRAKFLPSVVGFAYDFLRYECYLGNIGLRIRAILPTHLAAQVPSQIVPRCARLAPKWLQSAPKWHGPLIPPTDITLNCNDGANQHGRFHSVVFLQVCAVGVYARERHRACCIYDHLGDEIVS